MKLNSIYIDFSNKAQVKWWNEVGSKLIKVVSYNEIVETATNKPVGCLFRLKGLRKGKVIKEGNKFLSNLTTVKIRTKV